jgi:hypothetical protein
MTGPKVAIKTAQGIYFLLKSGIVFLDYCDDPPIVQKSRYPAFGSIWTTNLLLTIGHQLE